MSISSSSERADHSVSAEVADHAPPRRPAPRRGRWPGARSGIDIGIANQGPPTFRPLSTGFIPRIRDNPQKRNSSPFTVHRNQNRNHKRAAQASGDPKADSERYRNPPPTATTPSVLRHPPPPARPPYRRSASDLRGLDRLDQRAGLDRLDQRRGLDRLDQRRVSTGSTNGVSTGSTNEAVSTGSTNGRGLDRLDQREGSRQARPAGGSTGDPCHHAGMRMLVTSFPGRGHLNPVLPLAIAAQQAGHDVRVATGADQLAHVTRYELEPVEIGPGLDDLIDATRRGYGTAWGEAMFPEAWPRTAVPHLDLVRADLDTRPGGERGGGVRRTPARRPARRSGRHPLLAVTLPSGRRPATKRSSASPSCGATSPRAMHREASPRPTSTPAHRSCSRPRSRTSTQ